MSLYVFYGVLGGSWLASIVLPVVAIRWATRRAAGRFWPGLILSLVGLATTYFGFTRFHLTSTTTVNGKVKWHFDSHWLFAGSAALGAFATGYTIWRTWKHRQATLLGS